MIKAFVASVGFVSVLALAPVAVSADSEPLVIGDSVKRGPVLPQGTTVRLRTVTPLNSQDNKTGDQFDLEVAEDVMVNDHVVIPRGSPATGEVSYARKKGMWGKSGKLATRLIAIRVHGHDIPIRGASNEKGEAGTAGVVGAILILPVAGFFVTGTTASIPAGTTTLAKTDSDIPLRFKR